MTERLMIGEQARPRGEPQTAKQLLGRLFRPTVAKNIEDQRRLALLLPLLAALVPLVAIGIFFVVEPALRNFLIFLIVSLIVSFGLAHTKYYQSSLLIVVLAMALAPFFGVILQERYERNEFASIFIFIFPALVLSQIFFSAKKLLILTASSLLGILLMSWLIPELPFMNTIGAYGIILPTASLLFIAIMYRNNLEKDRLGQLEALVDMSSQMASQAVEASRLKSELLAKVSHELRTPLGAILGTTQLLESGTFGELSQRQIELSGRIVKRTRELTLLVEDLLDQSQFEQGYITLNQTSFSPEQLLQNCEETMSRLAEAKGLNFIARLEPDMPTNIVNDLSRLNQITNNLLGNAIKYTQYGQVKIKIARDSATHWLIEVSDTGSGIPEEAQSNIFEPFRQGDFSIRREKSGVGLGLAIVKQITTLMGGEIILESQLNQGSVFKVVIPFNVAKE